MSRRTLRWMAVLVLVGVAAYFLAGHIGELPDLWRRLKRAKPGWLAFGMALEAGSIAGYVVVFHAVVAPASRRLGWRASGQITLAGIVATKLLATAGAGGVALNVWALRAAGLSARESARSMVALLVTIYAFFMGTLVVAGLGLVAGTFNGGGPKELTLLPAVLAAAVIAIALAALLVPRDVERRVGALARRRSTRKIAVALAGAPAALHDGVSLALARARERPGGLAGALLYWAGDIAVLWVGLRAFGAAPSGAIVVIAYFIGQLANVLPLPGGVGGVEGGLIGALVAFGVAPGTALLGVLAYRAISYWLPTLPGAFAYVRLRREVARWREAEQEHPDSSISAAA